MGFTLFFLSVIVFIPFAGLMLRTFEISWADFWHLATTERALAAYKLTFGASLIAALRQRRLRHAARVGARALRISGPPLH